MEFRSSPFYAFCLRWVSMQRSSESRESCSTYSHHKSGVPFGNGSNYGLKDIQLDMLI